MKHRRIVITPAARADLLLLFDRVLEVAGPAVAFNYLKRVESFIDGLAIGSQRGTLRNEVRRGLRVIGFERRISIAFKVYDEEVAILRVFAGGQNWQEVMKQD